MSSPPLPFSHAVERIRRPHGLWSPAARRVADEIEHDGPLTFARFMELALFDPTVGYYARPAAGPGVRGDYLTSPELHAAFGGLLCLQLAEMWEQLGRPSPCWLVEAGPGSGACMADVLRMAEEVRAEFWDSLRVLLIEPSAALRARQQARLARWAGKVAWVSDLHEVHEPPGPGILFANEVLDALPFHRVVMDPSGLQELYVNLRGDELVEEVQSPSSPRLSEQIELGGGRLKVGQRAEVSLAVPDWVARAAGVLERGFLLFLDYGAPADLLYGDAHPEGTLRCFDRHTLGIDPLAQVGEQDLTADVDFTGVTRAAASVGWDLRGATTQASLLGRLGLPLVQEWLEGRTRNLVSGRPEWEALRQLADSDGLGRLLVVVFSKGVQDAPLTGLHRTSTSHPPRTEAWWSPRDSHTVERSRRT